MNTSGRRFPLMSRIWTFSSFSTFAAAAGGFTSRRNATRNDVPARPPAIPACASSVSSVTVSPSETPNRFDTAAACPNAVPMSLISP